MKVVKESGKKKTFETLSLRLETIIILFFAQIFLLFELIYIENN